MRKLNWLSLILATACTGLAGAQETSVKLPDIGSSAASAMSPGEMKAYGASMLHEMRAYNYVLDDPLVSDYLQDLGYRLVSYSDRPDLEFTFFVVRSNDINAFAAPGGYIGVNVGLINAMSSEDELAAVIAHEIAHVTQQHLLRAFEDSKKSTIPIALAMLGALVASAGRSDDASQAALMSGISLIQQRAINFTRYDEIEADRVGIQTLTRAGFEPLAMAETFATMQRVMRVNGVDVPEVLRTHPVDVNRIADAKARAVQLHKTQPLRGAVTLNQPSRTVLPGHSELDLSFPGAASKRGNEGSGPGATDTNAFVLMKERARTLAADSANSILRYYSDELEREARPSVANRYGHALALVRARQPRTAIAEFKQLTEDFPDNLTFMLGLAHAEDQAGQKNSAFSAYQRLNTNYPGNRAIVLAYTDALLAREEAESARRAQDLLRPLIGRYTDDPELQHSFARASELAGESIRAAEAYAEWAYLNGRVEDALNQLKALSSKPELTYYQRARVEARITAMTPAVLDMRKSERRQPDADGARESARLSLCPQQSCLDLSRRRNIAPLQ